MSLSKLDLFYRRLILTKFYTRGWGKPEELQKILKVHRKISKREACVEFINGLGDQEILLSSAVEKTDCITVNGSLKSPMCHLVPELAPEECKTAHFQLVLPSSRASRTQQKSSKFKELALELGLKPMCIHMAGTGDHGFARRRELLAKPLLSNGISSLLLENPYYGVRKPKGQTGSGLLQVKDLFIMGLCLVLEAQILLSWLEKEGYGPLGLTGISMGGHMASLAATNWPKPLVIAPCMSWTSASVVWTEGVLSKAIPWRVLESQYAKDPEYEARINDLVKYDTVNSYELGKDYVKDRGAIRPDSAMSKQEVSERKKNLRVEEKTVKEKRQRQTVRFMKGVMDQVTDIRNFSVPVDPTLATFVVAKADAYYPIDKLKSMNEVWPGCEVRILNTGHIAGFLMHHRDFCLSITDTFERMIKKYYMSKDPADETQESCVSPLESPDEVTNSQKSLIKSRIAAHGPSFFQTLRVFAIKS